MYQILREQFLPIPVAEAWDFFSSPKNLATITPPELDFKILSELPNEIYEGMRIDYLVKPLLGIPVHWQTEIRDVDKRKFFTDVQLKGPYKVWEHTHTFLERKNGVLMRDEVNYQLPFGVMGKMAHALIVKKKLDRIFAFRKQKLDKIFTYVHH